MVWLALQATLHEVYGSGLRGPSSSSVSTIDVTSNDSRFEYDECKHRRAQEEGWEDPASLAVAPGDVIPPPDVNSQVGTLINEETERDVDASIFPMAVAETKEDDAPGMQELNSLAAMATIKPCTGKAEVWIGSTSLDPTLTKFDLAKLWVISSDSNDHAKTGIPWKALTLDRVPKEYKGDKQCAKFFTIGAWATPSNELRGGLNHNADIPYTFSGGVFVQNPADVAVLKSKVDEANANMNWNFAKTELKYNVLPFEDTRDGKLDWYPTGIGWNEFNTNGYISGLMSLLGMPMKKPYGKGVPGWMKPVPKELFQKKFDTNAEVQRVVYNTRKCIPKTGLWVGYHPVKIGTNWYEHAKIWVISSDANHHAKPEVPWQDLSRDRVPFDFDGGMNCAKFYSVGADEGESEDKYNLVGAVNRGSDLKERLYGAARISSKYDGDPVGLFQKIDNGNRIMNGNFHNTALKRDTPFPRNWNDWGLGWNEFNSNGYIHGLLRFLGLPLYRPRGKTMPGWDKNIPNEFFERPFASDEEVKGIILKLHRAPYAKELLFVEGDEETHAMQQGSLDP
ncbi:hypothetical protein ACHAWU_006996 [Discostella pseudostelligera]|uniref:Uncharacterized protein n=1 Tax=Discostella pseudostelligera TaxID=259834 RepID=A0ABD3MZV0_9STRA